MEDPADRTILTVTELTALLKSEIERNFSDVWVEGEISNLRQPSSGHLYLTLKDASSQIRVVVFRSLGRLLRFKPEDGLAVIVRGHLTVYEARGEVQIVADYLEPKGVGALQLAFEQLREKLFREGLFDEARKKPIPFLPERIAVVTSPTGAVIRDILHVAGRRFPSIPILVIPTPVQGPGAAPAIVEALDLVNARGDADVIILARGGGSIEDLWAFNEEVVARAVARSSIPVISAVGHETDFTIADFVADVRAPTPSAAAEMAVPVRADLEEAVLGLVHRLRGGAAGVLERLRSRLRETRRALVDPARALEAHLQRVDDLSERLQIFTRQTIGALRARAERAGGRLRIAGPDRQILRIRAAILSHESEIRHRFESQLAEARSRVAGVIGRLDALSPLSILERGYCVASRLPDRTVVRRASDLFPGDRLLLTFRAGSVQCEVERVEPESPRES